MKGTSLLTAGSLTSRNLGGLLQRYCSTQLFNFIAHETISLQTGTCSARAKRTLLLTKSARISTHFIL